MTMKDLLNVRAQLEQHIRQLIGKAVIITELDLFALPCGCSGYTANIRGLVLDDLEVFEEHILTRLEGTSEALGVPSNFIFSRIIPGTQEIASLNTRDLCPHCYKDFATTSGKRPRPDIYILKFKKRKSSKN